MIVSVSRRCDFPRFSFDLFLEKLNEGFIEVKNPFNPQQVRRLSLLPPAAGRFPDDCAEVFAFWTRDPVHILKHAEELEKKGYGFFVMVTVNSYPAVLEPNVPPAGTVIRTMKELAEKISPDRVMWRYDPVLLSNITDFEFHRGNFSALAAQLNGTVKKVIISVYDEYSRAEKRLSALEKSGKIKKLAHYQIEPTGQKKLLPAVRSLLAELSRIAASNGMEMQSCAEEDLPDCGIRRGACIDAEYLSKLYGEKMPNLTQTGKNRNQTRPGCLCAKSVDIGSYGPCPAGCAYCYARAAE